MEEREHDDRSGRTGMARRPQDGGRPRIERAQSGSTERDQHGGAKEIELTVQVRTAGPGCGRVEPVPRGPALEHVEHTELWRS
jgi:hypothetical protein